jgi:heme-degrading monooxygenase HmoA
VYTIAWQFTVEQRQVDAFVAAYGPAGDWAELFRRAQGFRGTTLLRDAADPLRYVTLDRWDSLQDFERFREEFGSAYVEMDARFERLTSAEQLIGRFLEEI